MKKALGISLGIVFLAVMLFLFKVQAFYNQINTKQNILPAILQKPAEKKVYNLLFLGYGGGTHEGTYLTDTMMIAHVDTVKKKVVLISLPRDLWIQLPTNSGATFHAKINSIYELGLFPDNYPDVKIAGKNDQAAAELIKSSVTNITGISIDYYAAIDFAGFVKAIDLLGGLDINVEKTFDDYEYPVEGKETDLCGRDDEFKQVEPFLITQNQPTLTPDQQNQRDQLLKDHPDLQKFYDDITNSPEDAFPCRYEHLHFDKGPQHMDGQRALKYARSRHSAQDGDDFGRAVRQQKVIEAVKDKVFTITFVPKLLPLMDEVKNDIKTDLDLSLIKKFTQAAKKSEAYSIASAVPDLTQLQSSYSDEGQFILIPTKGIDQWSDLQIWIQNVIAGITPTPVPNSTITPTTKNRIPTSAH